MTFTGLFRAWATVLVAMLAAILLTTAAFATGAGAQEQPPCSGKVVLDPGHGGTDSGAVNTKYRLTEKEQTLDVANKLEALLEEDGCTVYMTRTDDRYLTNTQRANKANTVFGSLSALPAANGTGTIATRKPYSFASGVLLKSDMPATIAETVFITSDREGQLLSNSTGARQQQIAQALRVGIENYLTTH